MNEIVLTQNDELVMKLLHYFMTEKGYNPIILHGAKNEIWLENLEGDYKIIRIVSNYIHNDDQLKFDLFKTKRIMKDIKKQTFSIKLNVLSFYTNLGENVNTDNFIDKDILCARIDEEQDVKKYEFITSYFPDIDKNLKFTEEGVDLFIKITNDINIKNQKEAKMNEEVFSQKKPLVTYTLIGILILVYLIQVGYGYNRSVMDFAVLKSAILDGQYYRLFTGIFMHGSIIHLAFNCYALYIIGPQLESFLGKWKFTIIYLFSGLSGSLLSILFSNNYSLGASGAIFGLMGSLVYFGYHYRVYLGTVIKSQIIPLLIINLLLGMMPGIDNWAHVGGLVGGFLMTITLGIKYKSTKFEMINGLIITLIYVIFLSYLIFIRGV